MEIVQWLSPRLEHLFLLFVFALVVATSKVRTGRCNVREKGTQFV